MLKEIERTVCFTGHRPQGLPFGTDEQTESCIKLKGKIKTEIERLINEENAIHFISGMAMGIDMICAETVLLLKEQYPNITLECAIPCETQAEKWSERYRDRYFHIAECCDKETMLETRYSSGCMQRRNKYMVDCADFIFAVWNGKPSGTQNTIKYAQNTKKRIIYINPNDFQ